MKMNTDHAQPHWQVDWVVMQCNNDTVFVGHNDQNKVEVDHLEMIDDAVAVDYQKLAEVEVEDDGTKPDIFADKVNLNLIVFHWKGFGQNVEVGEVADDNRLDTFLELLQHHVEVVEVEPVSFGSVNVVEMNMVHCNLDSLH